MKLLGIFSRKPDSEKLRASAGKVGHTFLRNYKKSHRSRLENAIGLGELREHVFISDIAYDSEGVIIPEKLAVYADSQHTEALFFQMYAITKRQEPRTVKE